MQVLPVSMKNMKDSGKTFFIELYVIRLRTDTLYIAATDENITFNGQTYLAVPFQRQSVTRSMDNIVDSCEISLSDCDESLLGYVIHGFDFRGCSATIFRIMYPDSLTDPNVMQWVFTGTIDEPSFAEGTFTCKLKSRFPEIECPNRSYQLACNSEFGDECCGISLATQNVAIVNATGNKVTLAQSFANKYWKDGVIKVNGEARCIESSNGNELLLNVNFLQDNIKGQMAELSRGCNKTKERCGEYGNTARYSGFPAIPFESMYR